MSQNDTIQTTAQVTASNASPLAQTTDAFPKAEIIAILREEFLSAVVAEAELFEVQLPDDKQKLAQMAFDVDSLTAIEILTAVEPVVGMELPSSVVKAGGYQSIDDAIETLLPPIEKQWKKHNGVTT